MTNLKNEIFEVGKLIWEKDLTSGLSGNLSVRVPGDTILITAHGVCLGLLKDADADEIDFEGQALQGGFAPSCEYPFHTHVYKNLNVQAVVHAHPAFINGYFSVHDQIEFDTFETRLILGSIPVVDQKTPSIMDFSNVIAALKKSNIIVLKHHGVVAVGETVKDAFFLIQSLEEAVKMACIRDLYSQKKDLRAAQENKDAVESLEKKYALFSQEQIEKIVTLVNEDAKFKEMALGSSLETKLAVVLDETKATYCFHFTNGGISGCSNSLDEAEFVISGRGEYWRAIFNRELDPFAATTQKKLKLKGDFAKISRWYVPFNRLFELWRNVPVG